MNRQRTQNIDCEAQKSRTCPSLLISTGSCYYLPGDEMVDVINNTGADGIELLIGPELEMSTQSDIVKWFGYYEGIVHLHAPFGLGVHPGNRDHLCVETTIRIARSLNAGLLVIHPPLAPERFSAIESLRAVTSALCEALGDSCRITIENMPLPTDPWKRMYDCITGMDELAQLAQQLGLGLTFDVAHLATRGNSLIPTHREYRDLISNVHLSDYASGKQHLAPGEGELPLADYLNFVGSLDPAPCITLELSPRHFNKPPAAPLTETLRRALDFTRLCVTQGTM